jgi:hypothetical protein
MNQSPYLADLRKIAPDRDRIEEIRAAVAAAGFWESHDEWRIFTVTSKRIEQHVREGRPGFLVRVTCDHEFQCHCPTLERAVEFLCIYERLIAELFNTFGWPSWASPKQLDP